jgi:hypothetical protein
VSALTAFGLVAVAAMLIFYAVEDRSPWCILAFAVACVLGLSIRLPSGRAGARAINDSMPSSPLLSACKRISTYLAVTMTMSAQRICDSTPSTASVRTNLPLPPMGGVQRLAEGIKRARANVGVGDAHASEHKRPEGA